MSSVTAVITQAKPYRNRSAIARDALSYTHGLDAKTDELVDEELCLADYK